MLGTSIPTPAASSKGGWDYLPLSLDRDSAAAPGGASIRSARPSITEGTADGAIASGYGLSFNAKSKDSTHGEAKLDPNFPNQSLKGLDPRDSGACAAQDVQKPENFDGTFSKDPNVAQIPNEIFQAQEDPSIAAEDLVHDILAINTLAMSRGKTGALEEAMELLNGAYSKLNKNEHLLTNAQLFDQLRAMTLNNMGVTECHRSQPRHALSHFEAARQLEENHDIASPSVALNSCAAYNALGSYEKSTAAALEAIDMLRTLEMQRQQARKIARKRERQLYMSQQEGKDASMDAPHSGSNIPEHHLARRSEKSKKEDEDEMLLNDVGQLTIADSDNKSLWGAAWHNLAVAQLNTARHAVQKQDIKSERSNTLVIFRNAMKATRDFLGIKHPMTKAVIETYRAVRVALRNSGVFKQHHTLLTAPPQPLDPREQELEELLVEPKPGRTRHGTVELNKKELTITFRGDTTSWAKLVERLDPTPYPGAKEEVYQSNRRKPLLQRHRMGADRMTNSGPLGSIPLSATLIKASQLYGNPHPLLYTPSPPLIGSCAAHNTWDSRNQSNQNTWPEHKSNKEKVSALRQPLPPRREHEASNAAMSRHSDFRRSADCGHSSPCGNLYSKKAPTTPSPKATLGRTLELPPKGLGPASQGAEQRLLRKRPAPRFAKTAFPAVMNQTKCILMALPSLASADAGPETVTKTTYYAMPTELPEGTREATAKRGGEGGIGTPQRELHRAAQDEAAASTQPKGHSKSLPPGKTALTAGEEGPNLHEGSLTTGPRSNQPLANSSLPLLSGGEPSQEGNQAGELFDTMWVAASPAPVDAAAGVTGRLQLCTSSIDALWFDANGLTHGNRTFTRPEYSVQLSGREKQTRRSQSWGSSGNGRDCDFVEEKHVDHAAEENPGEGKPSHGDGMLPMALKADSSSTTEDEKSSKSSEDEGWLANAERDTNLSPEVVFVEPRKLQEEDSMGGDVTSDLLNFTHLPH